MRKEGFFARRQWRSLQWRHEGAALAHEQTAGYEACAVNDQGGEDYFPGVHQDSSSWDSAATTMARSNSWEKSACEFCSAPLHTDQTPETKVTSRHTNAARQSARLQ